MKIKGIKLNVPYMEKEEAKQQGAKWDKVAKTWYLPIPSSLQSVIKWIDSAMLLEGVITNNTNHNEKNNLETDIIRLYMQMRSGYLCYQCKSTMHILQLFLKPPKNPENTKSYEYYSTWSTPKSYSEFAKTLGIKMVFRSTSEIKTPYSIHVCPNCGAIQGDFYMFEDKDCQLPLVKAFYVLYDEKKDTWSIE